MAHQINERAWLLIKKEGTEETPMVCVESCVRNTSIRACLVLFAAAIVFSGSSKTFANAIKIPFSITEENIQRAPTYFKFQSRVSQGKIPVGDQVFPMVYVYIKDGNRTVCSENFENREVKDSVLNLEIGRGMNGNCDLDSVFAKYGNLSFVVCLNSEDNCLKPVFFGSVPYAVKSNFAHTANTAFKANQAVQCHYAHRVTADREIFQTTEVGKGYFDFHTPTNDYFSIPDNTKDMFWYEETGQSIPDKYGKGGYIQWAGMSEDGNHLHICASRPSDSDTSPKPLDELVMHANVSRFAGQLIVEGPSNSVGPGAVIKQGFQVGFKKDEYRMVIFDEMIVNGTANFNEESRFAKKVTVGPKNNVKPPKDESPFLEIYGNAKIYGDIDIVGIAKGTIAANSITENELKTNERGKEAVTTAAIRDGAVTSAKLANDDNKGTAAVATKNIQNEAVTSAKLANDDDQRTAAVATKNIQNGAITTAKLSITNNAQAVTTDTIRNRAVTSAKLANDDNNETAAVATKNIQNGAITTAKLSTVSNAQAVTTDTIRDGAVTSSKIDNEAITSDKLQTVGFKRLPSGIMFYQAGAVATQNIQSLAITTEKLANGAVTVDKIADYAVDSDKLGYGSVTFSKIGTGAVYGSKIKSNSITNGHLNLSFTENGYENCTGLICMKDLGSVDSFMACFLTHVSGSCQVKKNTSTKQWQVIGSKGTCKAMCF
jgi:hypothetical protein